MKHYSTSVKNCQAELKLSLGLLGIIEEIIKKTNNRAEAISLSETSLKMCKIFGKEKDIQVYNKVIYEFYLASEEEVTILRNQILQIE